MGRVMGPRGRVMGPCGPTRCKINETRSIFEYCTATTGQRKTNPKNDQVIYVPSLILETVRSTDPTWIQLVPTDWVLGFK